LFPAFNLRERQEQSASSEVGEKGVETTRQRNQNTTEEREERWKEYTKYPGNVGNRRRKTITGDATENSKQIHGSGERHKKNGISHSKREEVQRQARSVGRK